MDSFDLFRETAFERLSVREGAEMDGVRPLTDAFLAYWRGKAEAAGGLPARGDIQPTEIPRLLPHTVLLDVLPAGGGPADDTGDGGPRLLTRLIGTHVSDYFGEITGRDIDEMSNAAAAARIYRVADRVIAARAPVLTAVQGYAPGRLFLDAYAVYMPLAGADGGIAMILVGVEVTTGYGPADPVAG